MDFFPSRSNFHSLHDKGEAQILYCFLEADLETPISAWLKLTRAPYKGYEQARQACLFESVEGGCHRGRYSIVALAPDLVVRGVGERLSVMRVAGKSSGSGKFSEIAEKGFAGLRKLWAESRIELAALPQGSLPDDFPPMFSGLFGYMGFDTVRLFEDIGESKADPLDMADWFFIRPSLVAIFDSLQSCIYLVASTHSQLNAGLSAEQAYLSAREILLEGIERMRGGLPASESLRGLAKDLPEANETNKISEISEISEDTLHIDSSTPRSTFLSNIDKAKEHISAGDIFQVVLSQRFSSSFSGDAFSYYRALRRINPSPYLYYLDFGDEGIVAGSSPETLVRVRAGVITLRPLAGTRRRGVNAVEDSAFELDLLSDEKELAEHLMLLDLGRNDVGKVARVGSVAIPEQFRIERYSQVMHISSLVEGVLASDKDALDALIAGFPAGTVSGAPKVRAMQILTALEQHRRGLYAGGIGWLGANGDLDTCIALRTAIIKHGRLHVQVGAGIVADSVASSEFAECENKARALFKALAAVKQ